MRHYSNRYAVKWLKSYVLLRNVAPQDKDQLFDASAPNVCNQILTFRQRWTWWQMRMASCRWWSCEKRRHHCILNTARNADCTRLAEDGRGKTALTVFSALRHNIIIVIVFLHKCISREIKLLAIMHLIKKFELLLLLNPISLSLILIYWCPLQLQ